MFVSQTGPFDPGGTVLDFLFDDEVATEPSLAANDSIEELIPPLPERNTNDPAPAPAKEVELDAFLKANEKQPLFKFCVAQQLAIAFLFENKYGAVEETDEEPWSGRGGLYSKIRNDLALILVRRLLVHFFSLFFHQETL